MPLRRRIILCSIFIAFASSLLPAATIQRSRPSAAKPESDFALKDGDRVLFYGDSITEQRLYTTYVEHYVLTHYPDRRVTFINTGWGGDQVTRNECQPCNGVGGMARIERDVIAHRPTVVTLLFGMNDGRYRDFDPATLKTYEDGLTAIIRELKTKTRARLFVMTPTAYDPDHPAPWSNSKRYDKVLDHYSEAAKQIAAREGLPVIDLHTVTTEALEKAKQIKSDYTFLPDGVHPGEDGQMIMAAEILRAWGAFPLKIEISDKQADMRSSIGGSSKAQLTFEAPLPWPAPLPSETVRRARPEVTDLGLISLKIRGIPSGKYMISVDGSAGVEYTADQIKEGIPVSSEKARQASRFVADLVRKRADLFFMRWRQIEVPLTKDYKHATSAISSIDAVVEEMTVRARALSKPYKYEVTITPVQ
jgi:hypothetical protein